MVRNSCRALCLALFVGWALTCAVPLSACPFCSMQGQTLTEEVNQAAMVLYGTLKSNGSKSELVIEAVLKDHEIRKGAKQLPLDREVPEQEGYKFLVLCDVFKGRIDPFRGIAVKADSDMPKYIQGALAVKDASIEKRLKFFFDYLDNKDDEISMDAYKEFANADYKDYREMAGHLPAEKVSAWLANDKTPSYRLGLYGSMLGHCGAKDPAKYANVLRHLLDDKDKRLTSGVDGILAGYVLLEPKEGWQYVRGILDDPQKEFLLRYAALRTVRFFWDYRPDVIPHKDAAAAASVLLAQKDIADLAIEDLRKWGCWDVAEKVLALRNTPAYEISIVRRSILRYCLGGADKVDACRCYVEEIRKKDPEGVRDAEELLKLEQPTKK
jgi:hypothetical protein